MDKKDFLLIAALVMTAILAYFPHFNYAYPMHLDEWYHLGKAARIKEVGMPYLSRHGNVQVGFDLILVALSSFTDVIQIYRFLPVINILIISAFLFYSLRKKYNYWIGLFSLVFLASLKSNVNILGLWFYVPVTASIVFNYLALFKLEEVIEHDNPKGLYLVILSLFIIAFIHQSSFLVILLTATVYLSVNHAFVVKNRGYFYPFILLAIPALIMFRAFGSNFGNFLGRFLWGPIVPQINYNPFLLYGVVSSLFGFIGYYKAYRQKKLLPFRIYTVISLVNILIFPLTNFTVFSAYQRYIYHFMLGMVPFSAVGFYHFVDFLGKKLKRKKVIIAAAVIVSLLLIFGGYWHLKDGVKLYKPIRQDELTALKDLEDYPGGFEKRVLAPLRIGTTVKAVTGHEPALTLYDYKLRGQLNRFYDGSCATKMALLKNDTFGYLPIYYIYSPKPIGCNFTRQIYSERDINIYIVDRSLV